MGWVFPCTLSSLPATADHAAGLKFLLLLQLPLTDERRVSEERDNIPFRYAETLLTVRAK
jgi:hypothetical protein